MIHPAPTTPIAPHIARGELLEVLPALAARPACIVVAFPNTSYQVHLVPTAEITTPVGKRILGTVRARTRRVDAVGTGGKYVEPVFGKPRRVQGTVIAVDDAANTITVNVGFPMVCTLGDQRQRPSQFAPGQMVAFDLPEHPTFTPEQG